MNYFIECFTKKFCCFSGRARRQEYWMFVLFSILTILASMVIGFIIPVLGLILYVGFALAALLPGLAVCVRRLHDTDKSGWWILINLVPFGGLILLIFMIMDSTPGENMYGPNPKGV